jgi:hypothetical protein
MVGFINGRWMPNMIALKWRCRINRTWIQLNVRCWDEWTGRTNMWVSWADESEQLSYKKWKTRLANSEHNLRVVSLETNFLVYLRRNRTEDCSILRSIVRAIDRRTEISTAVPRGGILGIVKRLPDGLIISTHLRAQTSSLQYRLPTTTGTVEWRDQWRLQLAVWWLCGSPTLLDVHRTPW